MVDIQALKELAEDAIGKEPGSPAQFLAWQNMNKMASPAAVLELVDRVERISARLCMCRDCGGQGEVYSGHSTYQGQWQPPEPDMVICGTCGGDGVLGPLEDFEALAAERDKLKAESERYRNALRRVFKTTDGAFMANGKWMVNGPVMDMVERVLYGSEKEQGEL